MVAALAMPSLISKFQKQAFATAFKKQYNVLSNTIDFLGFEQDLKQCYVTVINDPDMPGNRIYSSNNTDCVALKKELISKLKLSKIENNFNYTDKAKVRADGGVSVNWTVNYDAFIERMSAYMLPDGAVLMFTDGNEDRYNPVLIVVDINGKKGPNRWGYDVFYLTLTKYKDKLRLTDEYSTLSEKGGSLPRNILMNQWGNEFAAKSFGIW